MITNTEETKELRKMLEKLKKLGAFLTSWEVEFIENMEKWENNFTDRQAKCIKRIMKKWKEKS